MMSSPLRDILPLIKVKDWTSPSVQSGVLSGLDEERTWRCRGCLYIEAFLRELQLQGKQALLSTAFFYLQVFHAYIPFDREDLGVTALGCVFLACKVGESQKKMREIVKAYQAELQAAAVSSGNPAQQINASTAGALSELEVSELRDQLHKIEFFVLRAIKFHLEMPPAEGRLMLDVYLKRFRALFVDGRFELITDEDGGDAGNMSAAMLDHGGSQIRTRAAITGADCEDGREVENAERRYPTLPFAVRILEEGATWEEHRLRTPFVEPRWGEDSVLTPPCTLHFRLDQDAEGNIDLQPRETASAVSSTSSKEQNKNHKSRSKIELRNRLVHRVLDRRLMLIEAAKRAGVDLEHVHEDWLDPQVWAEIRATARNFYTDAFRTFVVLQFLPHKIALAALFLSIVFRCQKKPEFATGFDDFVQFLEEEEARGSNSSPMVGPQPSGSSDLQQQRSSTVENNQNQSKKYGQQADTTTPVVHDTPSTAPPPPPSTSTSRRRTAGDIAKIHRVVSELLCFLDPSVSPDDLDHIWQETITMVKCHTKEAQRGVRLKKPAKPFREDDLMHVFADRPDNINNVQRAGAPAAGVNVEQEQQAERVAARVGSSKTRNYAAASSSKATAKKVEAYSAADDFVHPERKRLLEEKKASERKNPLVVVSESKRPPPPVASTVRGEGLAPPPPLPLTKFDKSSSSKRPLQAADEDDDKYEDSSQNKRSRKKHTQRKKIRSGSLNDAEDADPQESEGDVDNFDEEESSLKKSSKGELHRQQSLSLVTPEEADSDDAELHESDPGENAQKQALSRSCKRKSARRRSSRPSAAENGAPRDDIEDVAELQGPRTSRSKNDHRRRGTSGRRKRRSRASSSKRGNQASSGSAKRRRVVRRPTRTSSLSSSSSSSSHSSSSSDPSSPDAATPAEGQAEGHDKK
ncbi:unnamed protein product [Amoebophrya sp. A120]|nr:unnamed protein product [Amoebophrya sp. A120]|eukprot:GSA120T00002352001.1